jgi:hypothetical protein
MAIDVVFEVDGVDALKFPVEVLREGSLLVIAAQLAADKDIPLSDVNLRFIDRYEEMLSRFPGEDLAEPEDADTEALAATGGCRTCAAGTPCQTRIDTDVEEILHAAGLAHTDALLCLQYLAQEEMSSLTHDIAEMAAGFLAALGYSAPSPYLPPEHSADTLRDRVATTVQL